MAFTVYQDHWHSNFENWNFLPACEIPVIWGCKCLHKIFPLVSVKLNPVTLSVTPVSSTPQRGGKHTQQKNHMLLYSRASQADQSSSK